MFKFSKLSWSIFIAFGLALICVMFNTLVNAFVYPALVLLLVGFVLLTISLFNTASKNIKRQEMVQQELIMELSVTDEGEAYVLNEKKQKKFKKALRKEKFNKFLPAIVCMAISLVIAFLLIKVIFKF